MLEGNTLLSALRSEDRALVEPHLKACELECGTVLHDPGETVDSIFFPRWSAMAAYLVLLDDGVAIETTMVGKEGALVSQHRLPAYSRCVVLNRGSFYTMPARALERAQDESLRLRNLFARYADCLMAQVLQSVACNAAHSIEQRAAKWLNTAAERTGMNSIAMTQEQLASMMGIGRSYASRVLQRLKADGLIRTRRGAIDIRDPERLAQRACSCNDQVSRHYSAVLGTIYPD